MEDGRHGCEDEDGDYDVQPDRGAERTVDYYTEKKTFLWTLRDTFDRPSPLKKEAQRA
jgi:hypothetical protein